MELDNQRRSSNIEDRRGMSGGGGGGGFGGLPLGVRGLGVGGVIIVGLILLVLPAGMRNMIIGQFLGGEATVSQSAGGGAAAPGACRSGDQSCDFVSAVLGSTEDVWAQKFTAGDLPNYGHPASAYENPVLVLFENSVDTGCGAATSAVGPFYCPVDHKLYIDPSFYDTLAQRLNAPGDFAQAYVVAHEIGHHVQNLIGATNAGPQESQNQHSVRVELQADCFAGVWGHTARTNLGIDDSDLAEALNAAHAIGDDTLQRSGQGYVTPASFTHGTSEQRMRWFRRGYDSGDAKQCDTMQGAYGQL